MKLIVAPQVGDAYELWTVPVRVEPVLEGGRLVGYDLEFKPCTLWTARAVALAGAPPPQVCELEATPARDLVRWRWADASGIDLETRLDLAAADERWSWLDEDIRGRDVRPPGMVEIEIRVERPSGRCQRGPRKPRPAPP